MHSENQNRINTVVETALKNINSLADVNTVIGKPIKTDSGDYIFPVSKVTLGILSGGGEYGKTTVFNKGSDLPFSAGNGAIISLKPCGFLIKTEDKGYKILNIGEPYEKLIDKAADYLAGLNEKNNEEGYKN